MAKLSDSEAVMWRQAEHIKRLRQDFLGLQRVLAALARRQGGILVLDYEELAKVPSGALVQCEYQADGHVVVRVAVTGGPEEPGSDS